ncbi:c-type cytochrome [Ramlibacter albus]|uniref:Cytochrome c n=1 Tax=Ramlibacter albus TaxID=2079448 RepID=A0A923M5R3_9BURK|nr:cytochrome c [Ramlibacter albus]MBC5764727.1 cytochrome c [Ramlibacter albus]
MQFTTRTFGMFVMAAALLLAGCGGGSDEPAPPPATPVTALRAAAQAQQALRTPTATELMDWAERQFPAFFAPSAQPNRTADPFVYRVYPATGNAIGVAFGDVYVLGPVTGGQIIKVGSLAAFSCAVFTCGPSAANGRTLYTTFRGSAGYTCDLCHGPTPGTGSGFALIRQAAGTASSNGDPSLIRFAINNNFGTPPMGQFSDLTDAQLADLAAYINATVYGKPVQ